MGIVVCTLLAALSLASCAGEEESRARKCERLREHLIDLRVEVVPEADRPAHRTALRNALAGRFTEDCQQLASAQLSCALAADDIVAATACTSKTASR